MVFTSKNRRAVVAVCGAVAWLGFINYCHADLSPVNRLQPNVEASNEVLIARLDKFIPDPSVPSTLPTRPMPGMTQRDLAQLSQQRTIRRGPGTNTFTVLMRLKGECPDEIEFHSDAISSRPYGAEELSIPERSVYLLFLKSTRGEWSATDAALPLVPMGEGFKAPANVAEKDQNISTRVIEVIISSLTDPNVRASSIYLLANTRDENIVKAVRPYVTDSNPSTRRNALYCLAGNQVIDVIPRIASLASAPGLQLGMGLTALQRYETPQAVPNLNKCLLDENQMVRENAKIVLSTIGDKSTIPYWLENLRNSKVNPYQAYLQLYRLIPSLGTPHDQQYFSDHKDEEIRSIASWWANEQAGKHGNGPPLVRPRSMTPSIPSTQPDPRTARGPAD